MNERIKELRKQAWDYVVSCDEHLSKSATDLFEEKFAEMIVRECAKVAFGNVIHISTYADAEYAEEQIQKHFGVKE